MQSRTAGPKSPRRGRRSAWVAPPGDRHRFGRGTAGRCEIGGQQEFQPRAAFGAGQPALGRDRTDQRTVQRPDAAIKLGQRQRIGALAGGGATQKACAPKRIAQPPLLVKISRPASSGMVSPRHGSDGGLKERDSAGSPTS